MLEHHKRGHLRQPYVHMHRVNQARYKVGPSGAGVWVLQQLVLPGAELDGDGCKAYTKPTAKRTDGQTDRHTYTRPQIRSRLSKHKRCTTLMEVDLHNANIQTS